MDQKDGVKYSPSNDFVEISDDFANRIKEKGYAGKFVVFSEESDLVEDAEAAPVKRGRKAKD